MKDHFTAQGIDITIYKQPRAASLSAYFTINGKRFRPCLNTDNPTKARAAAREEVSKLVGLPENKPVSIRTFKEWVEVYLLHRWPKLPVGDLTLRDFRSRLRNMAKTEGHFIPSNMTLGDAVAMTQRLLNRRTNGRTAINDREVIRQFWRHLMTEQVVSWPTNPAAADVIKIPPTEDQEPDPLSDEAAKKVLEESRGVAIRPVVLFCLGAGLRPAEACRVCWSDIKDGYVNVVNRKGKKRRPRSVPLNGWVQEELKQIREVHCHTGEQIYPFSRDNAFQQMATLCKAAGFEASLQQCRQTCCTKAILSGMKLLDYVLIFGHSLEVARRHYWRLGKVERSEAMEAVRY